MMESISVLNENNKNECIGMEVQMSLSLKFEPKDYELLIQITLYLTVEFRPLDTGEVIR